MSKYIEDLMIYLINELKKNNFLIQRNKMINYIFLLFFEIMNI